MWRNLSWDKVIQSFPSIQRSYHPQTCKKLRSYIGSQRLILSLFQHTLRICSTYQIWNSQKGRNTIHQMVKPQSINVFLITKTKCRSHRNVLKHSNALFGSAWVTQEIQNTCSGHLLFLPGHLFLWGTSPPPLCMTLMELSTPWFCDEEVTQVARVTHSPKEGEFFQIGHVIQAGQSQPFLRSDLDTGERESW